MGITCCVANQKGGVGKSTSTVNLSFALRNLGKRVLAVDADPQGSLTIYFGHDPHELERQERNLYGVLIKNHPPYPAILSGSPPLIASSIRLARADQELIQTQRYSNTLLREMLRTISQDYDYILIDCQPNLGILTSNALVAADLVLVPVRTDYLSAEGIPLLLEEIEATRAVSNPDLRVFGILPTIYNRGYKADEAILAGLKQIGEAHRITVFDPIARSTEFDKAAPQGRPTLETSPNTPGVEAYYKLAHALIAYEG